MVKKRSESAAMKEALVQQALAGIANGRWKSAHVAAKELGIPRRTLYNRVNNGKSRPQAREAQQHLFESEEQALVKWIQSLTVSGTPAQYSIVRETAEHIRNQRVKKINDDSIEHVSYPPLGEQWVLRFLRRTQEAVWGDLRIKRERLRHEHQQSCNH
jgi:hypothetical protein